MSTDIVANLRDVADLGDQSSSGFGPLTPQEAREAADEIERLRERVAKAEGLIRTLHVAASDLSCDPVKFKAGVALRCEEYEAAQAAKEARPCWR